MASIGYKLLYNIGDTFIGPYFFFDSFLKVL